MFRYVVVQEELSNPDLGRYRSYGIFAVNKRGEHVAFVSDVSPDPKVAAEIAALCTVGQLDPEQLRDVILNMI